MEKDKAKESGSEALDLQREVLEFDGLLGLIFKQLYALPIRNNSFHYLFVDKRWSELYQHPLRLFSHGQFDPILLTFPPSYYAIGNVLAKKIRRSARMTQQIATVTENDPQREEFLAREMFLHSFVRIPCKNQRIQSLLDVLAVRTAITFYTPTMYFASMSQFLPDDVIIQAFVTRVTSMSGLKHKASDTAFIKRLVEEAGPAFECSDVSQIPPEALTRRLWRLLIKSNCTLLSECPKHYLDEDMYEAALTNTLSLAQNGVNLDDIPEKFRTERICNTAIRYRPNSLALVPWSLITLEMCKQSVQLSGTSLRHVPKGFKTEEICEIAVRQNGYALCSVPPHMITEELCSLAVENSGTALNYVPINLRTLELCRKAVKSAGEALRCVPTELKTTELYEIAAKHHGSLIARFPDHLQTPEMYALAQIGPGCSLRDIPKEYRTPKMCLDAVTNSGDALSCVPINLMTKEIIYTAVRNKGSAIMYVPEKQLWSEELRQLAVSRCGDAIKLIPPPRTARVCELAVENDGEALIYISLDMRTEKVRKLAMMSNVTDVLELRSKLSDPNWYTS